MIVILFFFYKQKTAYEMRISDWSSDVCSSDLRRPVLWRSAADEAERHSTGRRSRREGTAETIVDAASLIAVAATRMSVSDTLRWPADDRVDEFKTPEIGRASCRERVCKYV